MVGPVESLADKTFTLGIHGQGVPGATLRLAEQLRSLLEAVSKLSYKCEEACPLYHMLTLAYDRPVEGCRRHTKADFQFTSVETL